MFQFPEFASNPYVFRIRYLLMTAVNLNRSRSRQIAVAIASAGAQQKLRAAIRGLTAVRPRTAVRPTKSAAARARPGDGPDGPPSRSRLRKQSGASASRTV